jgi:hypothetical protein
MEQALITWLYGTRLSEAVITIGWIWPAAETLHFAGMALLVGAIGVLDMRMVGLARQLPAGPLHRFVPWGIAGFVVNLLTGIVFVAGAPDSYIGNTAFYLKMLFVILAGANVGLFYLTGVFRKVEALGPGEQAPPAAMLIGASSLIFWIAVIYFGRHLSYF